MLFGLVSLLLLSSAALAQFNIQLVFNGEVSAAQRASFDSAVARWQQVITGDIGNTVTVRAGTRICGQAPLAADLRIDDLLIFATIEPIDGIGRVLGSAGPCGFDNAGKVRLGSMRFDSADVANLLATNRFTATVLHEMGHIIGVGGVWGRLGLVSPTAQGTPFTYEGTNGAVGQTDIGGTGKPIVEDTGGGGTARVHWKETVYQNELMTGFISGRTQPLSKLTVQSLKDLGYQVNVNAADAFLLPGATIAPTLAGGITKSPTTPTKAPTTPTKAPTVPTKAPTPPTKAPTIPTKAPTNAGSTAAPVTTPSPTLATKSPTVLDNNNKFNIDVIFKTTPSPTQRAAFDRAVAKWQSVITGDIGTTVTLRAGQRFCGQTLTQDIVVDDVVIFADISPIDGEGRILGQAGPCGFDNNNRVRLGSMQFDSDDVANLEADGSLDGTILHEMGHVLGIGTMWEQNPPLITPTAQGTPFTYTGVNGIQGQADIGGAGRPIVEDIGGAGTARGHWKESVYQNELMTGFLSGNSQPMSRLTVQALKDLGYVVDVTKADDFQIPRPGRRLREAADKEQGRELQEEEEEEEERPAWELPYPSENITWNIEVEPKGLAEDGWEIDFEGDVVFDLETEPKPAATDAGAVAGGIIGALAVVGAVAFIVVRRRKSTASTSSEMSARNPMFNA